MKKIAYAAFVSVAAVALAACGSSDSASEEAIPENVEIPAEEAMGDIDATATPVVADTASPATDPAAAATAAPADAAAGVEAATADAEKKM